MGSLRSRLEALELQAPSEDKIDTIIISIVSPGENGPVHHEPIAMGVSQTNWRLEREPAEKLEAFRERAQQLCPRNACGMAMLLELYE